MIENGENINWLVEKEASLHIQMQKKKSWTTLRNNCRNSKIYNQSFSFPFMILSFFQKAIDSEVHGR